MNRRLALNNPSQHQGPNRRAGLGRLQPLLLGLLVMAAVSGCKLVELKMPGEPMSKEDFALRGQTREFAGILTATVRQTADEIARNARTEEVRAHAIEWKIGAAGAIRAATLRSTPSIALLDAWAFCRQMNQFLGQGGAGSGLFGEHQSMAITNAQGLERRIGGIADKLLSTSELKRMEEFLGAYVEKYPLRSISFERESVAARWEDFQKKPNPVAPAGTSSEALSDLAERIQILGEEVPEEVRWRLSLESTEMQRGLDRAGVTLNRLDDALKQIAEAAAKSPGSISNAVLDLRTNFLPVLDRFEAQWQNTIKIVQSERQSLSETVATERAAVLKAVDQQREAVMKQTQEMTRDLVDRSMNQVRGLVRDVLFYAVLLVGIILGAPFAIGFFLGRAWGRLGARPGSPAPPNRG